MGGQFSDLVTAVYCLYSEEWDDHTNCQRTCRLYQHDWNKDCSSGLHTITTAITWDEEGRFDDIIFTRRCFGWKDPTPGTYDPIDVAFLYQNGRYKYTVDGRDLCYAIAKAATAALKKYGFLGYHRSSGSSECQGDTIDINKLLFLKAYALDALNIRKLKTVWKQPGSWMGADGTRIENEIELLLWDM